MPWAPHGDLVHLGRGHGLEVSGAILSVQRRRSSPRSPLRQQAGENVKLSPSTRRARTGAARATPGRPHPRASPAAVPAPASTGPSPSSGSTRPRWRTSAGPSRPRIESAPGRPARRTPSFPGAGRARSAPPARRAARGPRAPPHPPRRSAGSGHVHPQVHPSRRVTTTKRRGSAPGSSATVNGTCSPGARFRVRATTSEPSPRRASWRGPPSRASATGPGIERGAELDERGQARRGVDFQGRHPGGPCGGHERAQLECPPAGAIPSGGRCGEQQEEQEEAGTRTHAALQKRECRLGEAPAGGKHEPTAPVLPAGLTPEMGSGWKPCASQGRIARPGVFLGVAVTLVVGAAGIGDGRVTGLPAVAHLADEALGAGRRALLTTRDETRPPGLARVAKGFRTEHFCPPGQGVRWQSWPCTRAHTDTPSSSWTHAWPSGHARPSHVGRQEGPLRPSRQKKPSGQLPGSSTRHGRAAPVALTQQVPLARRFTRRRHVRTGFALLRPPTSVQWRMGAPLSRSPPCGTPCLPSIADPSCTGCRCSTSTSRVD